MTELMIKTEMFNSEANNNVINNIIADSQTMIDYLVPQKDLFIGNDDETQNPFMYIPTCKRTGDVNKLFFHDNSIEQIGAKSDIPTAYLKKLHKGQEWQKNLFTRTLNDHFNYLNRNTPILLRTSKNKVKAYLSNSYERYNSIEVLKEFLLSFYREEMTVSHAYYDGITHFVELTNKSNPIIIFDQPHFFGIQYRNSDFGRAALDIKFMLIKQVCMNGMVMKTALRQIHKSRKMEIVGDSFQLSAETMNKETEAKKSLIRDIAKHVCGTEVRNELVAMYDKASAIDIAPEKVLKVLPSVGATQKDVEDIQNLLMGNLEHTGVREGGNIIRIANAVSYLANRYDNKQAESICKYREMSGKIITKFVNN